VLVTTHIMLQRALEEHYALPGFNVQTLEMVQAVVSAAEEERSPVLLQFNPGNLQHVGMAYAAALGIAAASQASVPVALHLDHGVDFSQAEAALRAGFTSLMYDGTPHSLERNILVTKQVCDLAHAKQISVEGEIGQMGGNEEGVFTAEGAGTMTDPAEALEYVQRTGVDSLAIAVGNSHGMLSQSAQLDMDRIAAIREKVRLPLVLHGASGVPDDAVREAIVRGVCKFNVATQLNVGFLLGFTQALHKQPTLSNPRAALEEARNTVKEVCRGRIRVFGSSGKA